jgi:hypothetical protein
VRPFRQSIPAQQLAVYDADRAAVYSSTLVLFRHSRAIKRRPVSPCPPCYPLAGTGLFGLPRLLDFSFNNNGTRNSTSHYCHSGSRRWPLARSLFHVLAAESENIRTLKPTHLGSEVIEIIPLFHTPLHLPLSISRPTLSAPSYSLSLLYALFCIISSAVAAYFVRTFY